MYFLFLLRKRKYPRPAYEHVAQPTSRRAARPTGTTGASTATNPRCQKKGGSLSDRRRSSRDQHTKPDAQPHGRKPEHVGRPARRWSKKRRPLWPTPLEQEPGTRTGCPAALARRLKTSARATSLSPQPDDWKTVHEPKGQGPRQEELANGTARTQTPSQQHNGW